MGVRKTAEQNRTPMSNPAFISSVVGIGLVVIVGAVLIGKSDQGQINVTATIQESNQRNRDAQGDASNNVNAVPEVFSKLPNGGLQPQETPPQNAQPETPPVEATSTTASSTPGGESGTQDGADVGEAQTVSDAQNAGQ